MILDSGLLFWATLYIQILFRKHQGIRHEHVVWFVFVLSSRDGRSQENFQSFVKPCRSSRRPLKSPVVLCQFCMMSCSGAGAWATAVRWCAFVWSRFVGVVVVVSIYATQAAVDHCIGVPLLHLLHQSPDQHRRIRVLKSRGFVPFSHPSLFVPSSLLRCGLSHALPCPFSLSTFFWGGTFPCQSRYEVWTICILDLATPRLNYYAQLV